VKVFILASLSFVGAFDCHPKTSKLYCRVFSSAERIFMG
jgi:hypothetical protein